MRHSIRAGRSSFFLAALVLLVQPVPPARAQVIGEAVELERTGRQASAAVVYLAVLRGEPTNLAALLGLERVLPPLGRLPELLPLVRRLLAPDSPNPALRGPWVGTRGLRTGRGEAGAPRRRRITLLAGCARP